MGCNFYFDPSPNEESKSKSKCDEGMCDGISCSKDCHKLAARWIHIGKSSSGWFFSVHTYPQTELQSQKLAPIKSWEDWKDLFESHKNGQIYDEYRCKITMEEMIATVEDRRRPDVLSVGDCDSYMLKQFASGELIYDKKTNLICTTTDKKLYDHACDAIGAGPWCCFSGRDFS